LLDNGFEYRVQCPRCGEYVIAEAVIDHLKRGGALAENRHLLSAVARRSWDRGKRLYIDAKLTRDPAEFEARILSQCPRGVHEKMDAILRYIAGNSKCPGHTVTVKPDSDYVRVFCKNSLEMGFLLRSLDERSLLDAQEHSGPFDVRLTAEGWTKVEELEQPNVESKQAFVAMWFDDQVGPAYTHGIAKLEEDTGFRMLRIDMKQFNEKICDHIIAEIRRSRFLIADVTGHRQGVYFEAGYAMGLGLPVIWTCRQDQVDDCHFDTRQYNHVTWETPDELREKLKDRILATVGSAT
jgi:nucleoside 2-deoxyribosyltransferase